MVHLYDPMDWSKSSKCKLIYGSRTQTRGFWGRRGGVSREHSKLGADRHIYYCGFYECVNLIKLCCTL